MKLKFLSLLLVTSAAFDVPLCASDAFLLQFNGTPDAGGGLYWVSTVVLYNGNDAPATMRVLGGSIGAGTNVRFELMIPPHGTTRLTPADPYGPLPPPMSVLHIDVPAGVAVQNRNEFGIAAPVSDIPAETLGHVPIPIPRSLTPANIPQVHIGADLDHAPTRINVVVYNAGDRPAKATIEVRRVCPESSSLDGELTDSRTISVAANEVVQTVSLDTGFAACEPFRNVIVTVDQPSLSFVTTMRTEVAPTATITMSNSEQF